MRGVCVGRYPREDVTAARAAEGATGATGEVRERIEGSHCSSLELGGYQNRCFDGPFDSGASRRRYTLMKLVWRRFNDELRSKFGFLVFRLSITLYPLLLYPRGTADASKPESASREYESRRTQCTKDPSVTTFVTPIYVPTLQSIHLETTNINPCTHYRYPRTIHTSPQW